MKSSSKELEEGKHSMTSDVGREKSEEECRSPSQGPLLLEIRGGGSEQSKKVREIVGEVEKREGETGGGGYNKCRKIERLQNCFVIVRRITKIFTNIFLINVLLSFSLSFHFFSYLFWRYFVFFRFGLVVFLSLPLHALSHRLLRLPDDAQGFPSSSLHSFSPTQMDAIIYPSSYSSYSTSSIPLSSTILPFSVPGTSNRRIGRRFPVSVERHDWRCWGRWGGGRERSEEEEEEEEEDDILFPREKEEEILQLSDEWRISLNCDCMRSGKCLRNMRGNSKKKGNNSKSVRKADCMNNMKIYRSMRRGGSRRSSNSNSSDVVSDKVDERRRRRKKKSAVCVLQFMRIRGGDGKKKMRRRTSGISDIQDNTDETKDEEDDDKDKVTVQNDDSFFSPSPSLSNISLESTPPTPSSASSDFLLSDDTFLRMFKQHWHRTPPLTKGYLSISAAITICAYFLNHNIWPRSLLLDWALVRRGQIWRLFTSFLYFGNFGLSYLLTTHFLWSYLSNLEKLHYANPEQFFVMILFGMTCLLIAYPSLGISSDMLGHNLSSFLVYVWSRVYEGQEVSILEMFPLRAECLPWFFVLQTWLVEGQLPLPDLLGICFGWIYFALNREGKLKAPRALQKIFENQRFRKYYEKYKTEFEG